MARHVQHHANFWPTGTAYEAFHEPSRRGPRRQGSSTRSSKAAWCYTAIAIDKLLNYNSTMSIWHARSEIIANTFSSHDFGMKWSYAEMAITIQGLGPGMGPR